MIDNIENNQLGYTANLNHHRQISGAQLSIKSLSGNDGNNTFSVDQVSFSYFNIEESATYSSSGSIKSAADAAYDLLRGYVLDVFDKQGMSTAVSTGEGTIDLATLTTADAQSLISDDGYFGVEQTSDRIVQFATGIAGNDPSRLDAILEGVEKGFSEAMEAFGGWLPEISHKTYDRIVEKLDIWANGTQTI